MKVIIAGSRPPQGYSQEEFEEILKDELTLVISAWEAGHGQITHIVEGGARGVDQMAKHFASVLEVPFTEAPADWDRYGNAAGHRRNEEMAALPEVGGLITLWNGTSPGTRGMIEIARAKGIPTLIWIYNEQNLFPVRDLPVRDLCLRRLPALR